MLTLQFTLYVIGFMKKLIEAVHEVFCDMVLDAPNQVVARALIDEALEENAVHTPAGFVFHKPNNEATDVTALPQPCE